MDRICTKPPGNPLKILLRLVLEQPLLTSYYTVMIQTDQANISIHVQFINIYKNNKYIYIYIIQKSIQAIDTKCLVYIFRFIPI